MSGKLFYEKSEILVYLLFFGAFFVFCFFFTENFPFWCISKQSWLTALGTVAGIEEQHILLGTGDQEALSECLFQQNPGKWRQGCDIKEISSLVQDLGQEDLYLVC